MTLIKNSSVVTNDTQKPQKYPNHQKQLWGHTSMREHDTITTPAFLHADGKASWLLLPIPVSSLSAGDIVQSMNQPFELRKILRYSKFLRSIMPKKQQKCEAQYFVSSGNNNIQARQHSSKALNFLTRSHPATILYFYQFQKTEFLQGRI